MTSRAGLVPATLAAAALLSACSIGPTIAPAAVVIAPEPAAAVVPARPNVVFILTDDLSSNIVPYMAEVQALAEAGVTFENYIVSDPQCCPSRTTILTGKYPHNSKVLTNSWPEGGFGQFQKHNLKTSLGVYLQDAGYRTGLMGKFLNGYNVRGSDQRSQRPSGRPSYPRGYVPPGWDEWHVAGRDGYRQFGYSMATAIDEPTATVERYGFLERDYLTDVLAGKAEDFIERAAGDAAGAAAEPFFLEVSTFATHSGGRHSPGADGAEFSAAPRDRKLASGSVPDWPPRWDLPRFEGGDCGDAVTGGCDAVPWPDPVDDPSFNVVPENRPSWMPRRPLSEADALGLRELHVERVRMAQSVDDLVSRVRAALTQAGVAENTYIVFSSDNGYHLGEHGLGVGGKLAAFDHDTRVPLIVLPPRGAGVDTVPDIVQNTDLLSTFLDIAGADDGQLGVDGRSVLPLIEGPPDVQWRRGGYIEFIHDERLEISKVTTVPNPYRAIRDDHYLYVDSSTSPRGLPSDRTAELYLLRSDPGQVVNRYAELGRADRRALDRALEAYADCQGAACWAAGRAVPNLTLRPG